MILLILGLIIGFGCGYFICNNFISTDPMKRTAIGKIEDLFINKQASIIDMENPLDKLDI